MIPPRKKLTYKEIGSRAKFYSVIVTPLSVLAEARRDMRGVSEKYWRSGELTTKDKAEYYQARAILFNEAYKFPDHRIPSSDRKRFLRKATKSSEAAEDYERGLGVFTD